MFSLLSINYLAVPFPHYQCREYMLMELLQAVSEACAFHVAACFVIHLFRYLPYFKNIIRAAQAKKDSRLSNIERLFLRSHIVS